VATGAGGLVGSWLATGACVLIAGSVLMFSVLDEALLKVPGAPVFYMPYLEFIPLLCGCVLAIAQAGALVPRAAGRLPLSALGIGGVAVGCAASSVLGIGHAMVAQLLFVSIASTVLIQGLDRDSAAKRFVSLRPFAALGTISYGFYLYFLPVYAVVDGHLRVGHAARTVVAFCLTLSCAGASYFLVERPFLRLKVRFSARVPAYAEPA
jgi:peptidoglycan/LPS O-acetylase OafA/YrhL